MSDSPDKDSQAKKKRESSQEEKKDENEIATCFPDTPGGLTEQQAREIREELDRAKEENSYSSSSRCVIVWNWIIYNLQLFLVKIA